MNSSSPARLVVADQLLAALRTAGVELPADALVEWHRGEARVRSGGSWLARVLLCERGGYWIDVAPSAAGPEAVQAAEVELGRIEFDAWRGVAGSSPWSLPFDRGPGLYPLDELDLSGVARVALPEVDVRIFYFEATCLADCIFCGRIEDQSDGVAESLTLAAIRSGRTSVEGAYVLLGGPEPTEVRDIASAIRVLHDAGAAEIAMIGTAESLADGVRARELVDAGLQTLSVPVYAASASAHDAIVNATGAFARLKATVSSAIGAGLRVYLHGLLLTQNEALIDGLAGYARDLHLPLVLGLPRNKQGAGLSFYPDPESIARVASGTPVLAAPPCLGGEELRGDGEALLRQHGPFMVYALVQAGQLASVCESCEMRRRCPGLPSGLIDAWAGHLVPYAGAP